MAYTNQSGSSAAAALLADRDQLRAVLRMMPVGVFIVDERGRLVESNPSAESIWGGELPRVALEGYGVYEGYWPESGRRLEPHEWALARTLRDGKPVVNEEVDIVGFDGTRRTVLHSTTALKDTQGTLLGAVAVKVDITTRRQAEHAEDFLTEATRLLVESLDWESTLQAVARLATRQLAEGCVIDVLGDDGELHRLAVAARDPRRDTLLRQAMHLPPKLGGTSPVARVFTEGRPLLVPDITPEHLDAHARSPEHRRLLAELGGAPAWWCPWCWGSGGWASSTSSSSPRAGATRSRRRSTPRSSPGACPSWWSMPASTGRRRGH
nr:PAS domain S-box protein [Archangium violaceum]